MNRTKKRTRQANLKLLYPRQYTPQVRARYRPALFKHADPLREAAQDLWWRQFICFSSAVRAIEFSKGKRGSEESANAQRGRSRVNQDDTRTSSGKFSPFSNSSSCATPCGWIGPVHVRIRDERSCMRGFKINIEGKPRSWAEEHNSPPPAHDADPYRPIHRIHQHR